MAGTAEDSVRLQLLQMRDQHFFADPRDETARLFVWAVAGLNSMRR